MPRAKRSARGRVVPEKEGSIDVAKAGAAWELQRVFRVSDNLQTKNFSYKIRGDG